MEKAGDPGHVDNVPNHSIRRRQVIAAIAAGAIVTGFDPLTRTWVRVAEAAPCGPNTFKKLPKLDGTVHQDLATRSQASTDAGNIQYTLPAAVLRPGSISDVVKVVKFCWQNKIKVAARGQGHTTFGHGLTAGLIIDMSTLATIHSIADDGAVVDGGVQWYDLVLAGAEVGLTPPVLTGYTQLSVGGTLSVGGVSSSNARGLQVDRVVWLDVVTGKGKLVRCSDSSNKKLFEAVLGGLGQFGVIVRAKVEMTPAPEFVRLYNLYYFDNAQFFDDLRTLLDRDELDDVFNLWFPAGPSFGYQLNAAIGFDASEPPDDAHLLRDLSQPAAAATAVDIPYVAYVLRVDQVIDAYKVAFDWQDLIKPWFDMWLPDSTVEEFVGEVIPQLTPADVGTTGFILMFPQRRSLVTRPFCKIPDDDGSDWIYLFDILTSSELPGPNPQFKAQMLARNRALFEYARDLGGKRYPIGSVHFTHADWVEHYGDAWCEFEDRKDKYDPKNILTPGLGIFP